MTPQSDVALAPLTTMGVGGPARYFVEARTESDLCAALAWARNAQQPVHVLGGGSNVVIADSGFDGLVIRVNLRGIGEMRSGQAVVYDVAAGEPWDRFVADAVETERAGIECLSGIPGCIGGTPVQNVGAYGQDVSQTITHVRVVDRVTGKVASLSNAECGFGYRTSRFKREDKDRYIVTRVEFALTPDGAPTITYADLIKFFEQQGNPQPTLQQVRAATLAVRRRKGMVIEPGSSVNRSCGSFFVNPVVSRMDFARIERVCTPDVVPHFAVDVDTVKIPAAWLIERAGFPKGTSRGAVGVSPFQAQAIVNHGNARAADVVALANEIRQAVARVFGITLVPEPVFVGFGDSDVHTSD